MVKDNNSKRLERRVRRSYFVSTISIALVLFLLGSVSYMIINAISATERMRESVSVYIMLDDAVDAEKQEKIERSLKTHEHVAKVKYVSKEQAAQDFRAYVGEDFEQFLQYNPLPNSFEVNLKARSAQKEIIEDFENQIAKWTGVNEVVYQKNILEQITSNLNKFNLIILLFGGALLVISLILLNNTIRVTILSKRYIINTMKLVGASQWFILRPFMGLSLLQGVYAGIISSLMLLGMLSGLNEGLPEMRMGSQNEQMIIIMGAMLLGGILISLIFTTFAVRKFIRMQTNNLYLY